MTALGRLVVIAGAAGVILSAFLPWVTVAGTPLNLQVGLLSVDLVPGGRTVSGTGTAAWPIVCGAGLLVLILAVTTRAGRLLAGLGALIALAGAGLVYYTENIVDFKTAQHGQLVQDIARATITSTTRAGPPLLLAGGLVILLGGLAVSRRPAAPALAVLALALTAAGVATAGATSTTAPAARVSVTAAAARVSSPTNLPFSNASSTVVQPQPHAGSCHATGTGDFSGPDPHCTPGARNPAVTQATIGTTICRSGFTATIRPSVGITRVEKTASLAAYGDSRSVGIYEYDHLISLELGGAPNDPRNLWPEPGRIPNPKDRVENRLHRDVCDHNVTLLAAQLEIAKRWVGTYHALFG